MAEIVLDLARHSGESDERSHCSRRFAMRRCVNILGAVLLVALAWLVAATASGQAPQPPAGQLAAPLPNEESRKARIKIQKEIRAKMEEQRLIQRRQEQLRQQQQRMRWGNQKERDREHQEAIRWEQLLLGTSAPRISKK
jgi:hypothetical protein